MYILFKELNSGKFGIGLTLSYLGENYNHGSLQQNYVLHERHVLLDFFKKNLENKTLERSYSGEYRSFVFHWSHSGDFTQEITGV